jgi:hypothetical protein
MSIFLSRWFWKTIKVDISKTQGVDRLSIFQREIFWTSFPAEVEIMATNFGTESTPIDPNIVILVKSYLSRIYIERETDFKTTFLVNFALTTPLKIFSEKVDFRIYVWELFTPRWILKIWILYFLRGSFFL